MSTKRNTVKKKEVLTLPKCEEFLRLTNDNPGFTIRVADLYIHAVALFGDGSGAMSIPKELATIFEEERIRNRSESQPWSLTRHRAHEKRLERIFAKCEEAVFNDPTVKYPGRWYLNGKTGTMSQLLLNGYFVYYNTLRKRGLEVNLQADVNILATLFIESINIKLLNAQEWVAILDILNAAKEENHPLTTEAWWNAYIKYWVDKKDAADTYYTYWKNNPEKRSLAALASWKPRPGEFTGELPTMPKPESERQVSFSRYEYFPYGEKAVLESVDFDSFFIRYIGHLLVLKTLFTSPEDGIPRFSGGRRRKTRKHRKFRRRT
jgi:hypothetical protein